MSTAAPTLTQVKRLPQEGALRLEWSDGFSAQPTYRTLCGYCPCAGCQGHIGKVEYHEPDPSTEPEPSEISQVGNYAISIRWLGGCQDGIYSFSFLRQISEGFQEVMTR